MTDTNTNLVLIMADTSMDRRKFIVWNIEGEKPVEVLSRLQITRVAIENQKRFLNTRLKTALP